MLIRELLAEAKWLSSIEPRWHPPENFFKRPADDIAAGLFAASKNKQQAMSRLNFYINRAGSNLSSKDQERLEQAKILLHNRF